MLILLVHPDVGWHNYYLETNNHKISLQRGAIFQAAGFFPCPGITDVFLILVVSSQDNRVCTLQVSAP